MKTIIAYSVAALLLGTVSAMANGNSGAAKGMVEQIQGLGADIAPTVSGQNAEEPGDSGWGNAGSRLTTGTQVSKSGKPD